MTKRTNQAVPETGVSGFKRMIGDGMRSRTDQHRSAEAVIAATALSRVPWLAPPNSKRLA